MSQNYFTSREIQAPSGESVLVIEFARRGLDAVDETRYELLELYDFVRPGHVLLDLGNIGRRDSSFLGILITMRQKQLEKNGDFRICGVAEDFERVLQITHVGKEMLRPYSTLGEAISDW